MHKDEGRTLTRKEREHINKIENSKAGIFYFIACVLLLFFLVISTMTVIYWLNGGDTSDSLLTLLEELLLIPFMIGIFFVGREIKSKPGNVYKFEGILRENSIGSGLSASKIHFIGINFVKVPSHWLKLEILKEGTLYNFEGAALYTKKNEFAGYYLLNISDKYSIEKEYKNKIKYNSILPDWIGIPLSISTFIIMTVIMYFLFSEVSYLGSKSISLSVFTFKGFIIAYSLIYIYMAVKFLFSLNNSIFRGIRIKRLYNI